MIAIRGAGSKIAVELTNRLAGKDEVRAIGRGQRLPLNAHRYLFCQGLLYGLPSAKMVDAEVAETFSVNAASVINSCNEIIDANPLARICVIGSESGFTWSYDDAYAAAKAALHRYVETKRLKTPDQQLICVAPGIIGDAAMTRARKDTDRLLIRAAHHPKKRFLLSEEVARLVHHVLYVDAGYLSGVVLRMNGGEHTCRA